MEPIRWIRAVVPVAALALVGAAALARPPVLEAADPPWDPPPCPPGPVGGEEAGSWFRLEGVVDAAGTLAGQRLVVGLLGAGGRAIELPAESFATGPWAGRVLVGADDGRRSRVTLVDAERSCARTVSESEAVVRSAVATPDDDAVLEHRVDRATRADLGIWRVPLTGGAARRILAGLAADARYGATFSTELRWAPDGRLVVTACGESRCRTRLLQPTTGKTEAVGPTGPVIGVTSDGAVIAHEPCGGFPCGIVRRAPGHGAELLVPAAGPATMAGDRVVFEIDRGRLATLDAGSGRLTSVEDAGGLVPVPTGTGARAGASRPADAALLARDGRLDGRSAAVLAADGTTPAAATEAVR